MLLEDFSILNYSNGFVLPSSTILATFVKGYKRNISLKLF